MLTSIHTTLRRLIYERGRIDPDEVDVRFQRPTREWLGALTAPTLNLFLYGVEENSDFRNAPPRVTRAGNIGTTRFPTARVDLRYMVAAFSSAIEDEQALIWRALAVLLRHPTLPPELLGDDVRAADVSLLTRVARLGGDSLGLDIWKTLEIPPRPCLLYTVTAPLDVDQAVEAPLVLTRDTRYTRPVPEDEAAGLGITRSRTITIDASVRIGGVVRDRQGAPLAGVRISIEGRALEPARTTEEGRYTLGPLRPGPLTLRVERPGAEAQLVPLVIPSETYDVVVD